MRAPQSRSHRCHGNNGRHWRKEEVAGTEEYGTASIHRTATEAMRMMEVDKVCARGEAFPREMPLAVGGYANVLQSHVQRHGDDIRALARRTQRCGQQLGDCRAGARARRRGCLETLVRCTKYSDREAVY